MRIKTKTFVLFSIILLIQLVFCGIILKKALFLENRLEYISVLGNNLVVTGKVRNQIGRQLIFSLLYVITGEKNYRLKFERSDRAVKRFLEEWQPGFEEESALAGVEHRYALFQEKNRKLFRFIETRDRSQGYLFFNTEILDEFTRSEGRFIHRSLREKTDKIERAYDELLLSAGWFPFGMGSLTMQMRNVKNVRSYFINLNETVSYINRFLTNSALLFLSGPNPEEFKKSLLGIQFDFILHEWKESLEVFPETETFLRTEGRSFFGDVEGALLHIQKKMEVVKDKMREGKPDEATHIFTKSIDAIVDFILYPTINMALNESNLLVFTVESEVEKAVNFSRNVTVFLLILFNVFIFFTSLRFLRELNHSIERILEKLHSLSFKKGDLLSDGDEIGEIESLFEAREQELQELVKVNHLFEEVIEEMKAAFFIVSGDFKIERANKAFCAMLGYKRSEVEGLTLVTVFPEARRERGDLEDFFIKWGGSGSRGTLISRAGESVSVLLSASLIDEAEQRPLGIFVAQGISDDMLLLPVSGVKHSVLAPPSTESARLIIAGLVKEYSRPLNNIMGYTRFLLENYRDELSTGALENLEMLSRESRGGARFSENLNAFFCGESVAPEKFSLNAVIEQTVKGFSHVSNGRCPAIHIDLDSINPTLSFERGQLEFMLTSLIRLLSHSAVSKGGGAGLRISTMLEDDSIKIIFSESQDNLPDEFFTLTGMLGMLRGYPPVMGTLLVMVFAIVKGSGGKIVGQRKTTTALEKEAEKQCLKFILEIPVLRETQKPVLPGHGKAGLPLRNRQILVVDDEKTIRNWLKTLVIESGGSPTVCENGAQAIEKLGSMKFDLIVSDVKMPELSGLDLGEWLERELPEMLTRFILITGLRDSELDEYCLKKKCHALTKPFSRDALLALFEQINL